MDNDAKMFLGLGATGGIGPELCRRLARGGAKLVRTPMTEHITRSETAGKASVEPHTLGKLGEPEDIATAIAYLLVTEAGRITGQTIGVDGGLSTPRSPVRRQAKA